VCLAPLLGALAAALRAGLAAFSQGAPPRRCFIFIFSFRFLFINPHDCSWDLERHRIRAMLRTCRSPRQHCMWRLTPLPLAWQRRLLPGDGCWPHDSLSFAALPPPEPG